MHISNAIVVTEGDVFFSTRIQTFNPINTTGDNWRLMDVIVQHQGLQTAQVKCIVLKTVVPFLLKLKS